jgi:hypothetical protein
MRGEWKRYTSNPGIQGRGDQSRHMGGPVQKVGRVWVHQQRRGTVVGGKGVSGCSWEKNEKTLVLFVVSLFLSCCFAKSTSWWYKTAPPSCICHKHVTGRTSAPCKWLKRCPKNRVKCRRGTAWVFAAATRPWVCCTKATSLFTHTSCICVAARRLCSRAPQRTTAQKTKAQKCTENTTCAGKVW